MRWKSDAFLYSRCGPDPPVALQVMRLVTLALHRQQMACALCLLHHCTSYEPSGNLCPGLTGVMCLVLLQDSSLQFTLCESTGERRSKESNSGKKLEKLPELECRQLRN
jgi:hypothetical protein